MEKNLTGSIAEIFKEERAYFAEGYDFVVGIDEAGRGPLAGPVTAAAVAWRNFKFLPPERDPAEAVTILNFETNFNDQMSNDKDFIKKLNLIKDSKKLSEKQREMLYDFIQENFYVGVGICDHLTIDRVNILEATYLAMKSAMSDLNSNIKKCHPRPRFARINSGGEPVQRPKDMRLDSRLRGNDNDARFILLVDGNKEIPNLSVEQRTIVGGDGFVKSISAASIIAKVTRDRMMREAHKKYPQYNFLQHKGYGTKIHMDALKKFGPCEIHRKSFRPVRDVFDMYRSTISN